MAWVALTGGAIGFFVASFVEYWGHRCMHTGYVKGDVHRHHHATGDGQGVMQEYWDYFKGTAIFMWPPFLVSLLSLAPIQDWMQGTLGFHVNLLSVPAGVGWLVGANLFAFFSAYAHQLQHDNPLKCFWMPMPIHFVHHEYGMWHTNFGMAVDWWDRIFGTYKRIDDWRDKVDPALAKRGMLQIRWW